VETGSGRLLQRKGLTKDELLRTVINVMTTPSYRKNAEKIRASLVDAGGVKKAIVAIEKYLQS
jgi:UDP:flavonoid glycosyltransferase YjiC (YdhE family)